MPILLLTGLIGLVLVLFRTRVDNIIATNTGGILDKTATAYINGNPVDITIAPIGEAGGAILYLETNAAKSFLAMQTAALADGVALQPTGRRAAFRTPDDQQSLVNEEGINGQGGLAGCVGHSHHQKGNAVDIAVHSSQTSEAYVWLQANAADYNFENTGLKFPKIEYWHWEYTA